MRSELQKIRNLDPRIVYRGEKHSWLDNLTDAVFGIAITLLIFNSVTPASFHDLITFTKTLPAFVISVGFLILIWHEHVRFSEVYGIDKPLFVFLNIFYIALVIFYVYPLKFLMMFLTHVFFGVELNIAITGNQVPWLTLYYGVVVFALYLTLFFYYLSAYKLRTKLQLNDFEIFYTKWQLKKQVIMFGVPALSISLILYLESDSVFLASTAGGFVYILYTPAMFWWHRNFEQKQQKFPTD